MWLYAAIGTAVTITAVLLFLTAKEIYTAIKENSEGRCSGRCDLD